MQAVVFFLPGRPQLSLVMCAVSLLFSAIQHALNRDSVFIRVPSLTKPLLFMAIVVLVTAQMTGGIGLYIFGGSGGIGGKRYIWLLSAILGYFAVTAKRIPPRKVLMYVTFFLLGTVATSVCNVIAAAGGPFISLLYVFPPDFDMLSELNEDIIARSVGIGRLGGLAIGGSALFSLMLAIYGIRGIFDPARPWRFLIFVGVFVLGLLGGFRSILIGCMMLFAVVFWLEGLMRSRLLFVMILLGLLTAAIALPFTSKMPLSVQRTLSFIPYIDIDPYAAGDAKGSTDWRLGMWKAVLPEVPHYLLLGKGYSINAIQLEMINTIGGTDSTEGAMLAGDYHSGPLSVIVPFGIAGVIGFLWFAIAGTRVLYHYYKFGHPVFKRINTFLLASFITKIVFFLAIFGSLYSDMAILVGLLALGVSVNGPVRKHAPVRQPELIRIRPMRQPHPVPAAARVAH
jgi:hypothetical protein